MTASARPTVAVLDERRPDRAHAEASSLDGVEVVGTETIRPPRFSPSQLARLESVSSRLACERPQQISTLLSSLVYFEAYCKDRESRSEEGADVHRMLYERTARARMLLEDGIERVLEHEDLRL